MLVAQPKDASSPESLQVCAVESMAKTSKSRFSQRTGDLWRAGLLESLAILFYSSHISRLFQ